MKKPGGEELAKVLIYYGLLNDTNEKKIVCPFHEDINPSMQIDLDKGLYFCYGCQKSGDAFNLVKEVEKKNGLSDLESLVKYNKILKSKKVEKIKLNRKVKEKENGENAKDDYVIAYMYYHGLSKVDWTKSKDEDILKVKKYMQKRGFNAKTLELCKAKITYNNNYPIVFPIIDNGKFKGWVCRTTNKNIEAKRKYLYNKGFRRAKTLAGNYKNAEILYIVEGYMDMLKLKQFGIKNVVAILGWKMSDCQIKKIKEANPKIIIAATDNDECGKKGAKYIKQVFGDKVYRFKFLKGIKDPGEMSYELFTKMNNKTIKQLGGKKNYGID